MTRNAILQSYEAQYELLERYNLTPSELEASIQVQTPRLEEEQDGGILILLAQDAMEGGG
ncbi:MAG: hypothetical protein EI684_21485 [Candidatus Viridilinea halotolerans]|uniref:Uncharacterized protein n=1 Tax=Candidatus Viridilinea halotolerans TaxID=2491704 RepID=A0A426TRG8_9CHLR|nr:MAG: hypothetical protein EI684_21485 [Candidatus Viridilinea halotolerans]